MNKPIVSIVILTRDRYNLLKKCISSIKDSTYKDFEVILIDNGSIDNTKYITKEFQELNIRYFFTKIKKLSRLRQYGIEQAKGRYVIMIDDDCVLDPKYIELVVKRFEEDENIAIIGGNLINIGFDKGSLNKGKGKIGINCKYETVTKINLAEVFGSACMSIRKEVFEEVGGYDLYCDFMEEVDLTLKVKNRGYKICFEPNAIIKHYKSEIYYRPLFNSPNKIRLYLFFKYFTPKTIKEWFSFFYNEFYLLGYDIKNFFLTFPFIGTIKKNLFEYSFLYSFLKIFNIYINVIIKFYLIFLDRIIIPFLYIKSKKSRI
ncbi:MAG: glycosyltransferase [Elusimicrobiota bacterium]|nr:glycosyltransferase [Endomicrobiia bacterium]MDW8166028.1 glycosyltransferase [Elusimicrobiota bacterium]